MSMYRYLAGLIAGAVIGLMTLAAVIALDQRRLNALVLVVALVAGLLAGALTGWRAPRPGGALFAGLIAGVLAGVLLAAADLAHGATATHRLLELAILSLAVCAGLGAATAGIVSAWTGYAGSETPQPEPSLDRGESSGPLGPMPSSA